jgi:hypothetical protein
VNADCKKLIQDKKKSGETGQHEPVIILTDSGASASPCPCFTHQI